ncbi:MAG: hypothetical protein EXQ59_01050 [Acidobacteria bacterium]|nr:hypothetical protein [Acidobacteriota bacterium]
MANLVLKEADDLPRFWRGLAAAVISPANGFNRLAYGKRFKSVFPSRNPAFFARVRFGAMGTASVQKSFTVHKEVEEDDVEDGNEVVLVNRWIGLGRRMCERRRRDDSRVVQRDCLSPLRL